MAHYETDAEVYEQLGGIFRNLLGNTERLAQLRQVDAVVQYAFEAPSAAITFDVRARKEPRIDLGETKLRPDIVLAMEADVGRRLLLGELNPTLALARGAVQAKGSVSKILLLVPAVAGASDVEADAPLPEPADEAPAATEEAAPEAAESSEGEAAPEAEATEEASESDAPVDEAPASDTTEAPAEA